jgi:UDP-N-acetylglucosamine 1-carboxyvinyltransferase
VEKFLIEGGVPLSGTIVPAGNKNAALPLLACSLLTSEEIVLHNVPVIRDVEAMLALLADLGVSVERRSENTVALRGDGAGKTDADAGLAEPIRASFLVAGPLLTRFGTRSARSGPRWGTAATSTSRRPRAACRRVTSSWTSRP